MSTLDLSVANVAIPGAGASLRVRWPRGITDPSDTLGVTKFGPQDANGFALTGYGGAGANGNAVFAGAATVTMQSSVGPKGVSTAYARRLSWTTERTGGSVLDAWACWSFRLTAAFTNPAGPIAGDLGLVVWCGNQNSMNGDGTDTNPGVKFAISNTSTVSLQARRVGGGALTVNEVVAVANTPDITKLNTYEIQIVTGSNNVDPTLFGLINGVVVTARYPWTAAAALLPAPNAVAGNYGYAAAISNRSAGAVPNMYVKDFTVTAAQSAAGLY